VCDTLLNFVLEPRLPTRVSKVLATGVSAHFLDTLTVDPDPLRTDSTVTDTRVHGEVLDFKAFRFLVSRRRQCGRRGAWVCPVPTGPHAAERCTITIALPAHCSLLAGARP
jgi:hypothetical protein